MFAPPLLQSDTPRAIIDLGDNRAREAALEKLLGAVSADAPPGLAPWSVPGNCAGGAKEVCGTVGNLWQHLNSLRVAHQYTQLLGEMCASSPFLAGDPTTCVMGLGWLSSLVCPIVGVEDGVRCALESTIEQFRVGCPHLSQSAAVFEAHKHLACGDRDLTRMLLGMHFSGCREYDVDICASMAASPDITYASWLRDFPRWRDTGLFFPLTLAARHMPTLGHWLPLDVHATPLARSLADCLNCSAGAGTTAEVLERLCSAWGSDTSGAAHLLAGTLDRIAVLMRVKSNARPGQDMRLDPALAAFPRSFGGSMHEANHAAWKGLASAVEDAFPPSLLLAPLVRPKKPTWGFHALTLRVEQTGFAGGLPRISFAENRLGLIAPEVHAHTEVHTHTPCFAKDCMFHQTSHRVQDVLWRLGEILTSPDVALAMIHPAAVSACLRGSALDAVLAPADVEACSDRKRVFDRMRAGCSSDLGSYISFAGDLEGVTPPVSMERYHQTLALLFWRVDIPPRVVLFVGDAADMEPASQSQHHLSKLLLNSKIHQRAVGGCGVCPVGATEQDLRGVLRTFAAEELRGHPCNMALAVSSPVVSTTLGESLACFALAPPAKLNTCDMGDSPPWKEDGIDPRYAEKQVASNGFRFRDWAAMHVGRGGTQQSRLAAHVVEFDALHVTDMPWLHDGGVEWVRVASTVSPQSRTLQGPTLRTAVENRFFHDPRMLPVRAQGDTVAKADAEVYMDGDARATVVYSPTASSTTLARRLEMIAFQLQP